MSRLRDTPLARGALVALLLAGAAATDVNAMMRRGPSEQASAPEVDHDDDDASQDGGRGKEKATEIPRRAPLPSAASSTAEIAELPEEEPAIARARDEFVHVATKAPRPGVMKRVQMRMTGVGSKALAEAAASLGETMAREDAALPGFRRVMIGELEGTMAQRMIDLFAVPSESELDVAGAIDAFGLSAGSSFDEIGTALAARMDLLQARQLAVQGDRNRIDQLRPGAQRDAENARWGAKLRDIQAARNALAALEDSVVLHQGIEQAARFLAPVNRQAVDDYLALTRASMGTQGFQLHASLAGRRVDDTIDLSSLDRVGGANAQVYRVHVGWRSHGEVRPPGEGQPANAAFKPDDVLDDPTHVNKAGIADGPTMRLAMRQVVFAQVAALLGLEALVPRTEYARVGGRYGILQEWVDGPSPLERDYVPVPVNDPSHADYQRALAVAGKSLAQLRAESPSRDELQIRLDRDVAIGMVEQEGLRSRDGQVEKLGQTYRSASGAIAIRDTRFLAELCAAEILDHLTGQLDRHPFNMIVAGDAAHGRLRLKLIDNDQAFGHGIAVFSPQPVAAQAPPPPYMDAALAARIMNLDPAVLRRAGLGMLTTAEQDRLVLRLQDMQGQVQAMIGNAQVIDFARLASDPVRANQVRAAFDDPSRAGGASYFARIARTPERPSPPAGN